MPCNTDPATQRMVVSQLWSNDIRKPAEIIKITGFPKSTIHDLVNRLKKRGTLTPLPIPGRPKVLDVQKHRYLGQLIKNNDSITAAEIVIKFNKNYPDLNITERTIQRTLKNNLQYVVCRPQRIPLLRPVHIEKRLEWVQNHANDSWSTTIFSDETTFQMFRNTQLVRHRRTDPRPHRSMVKHPYKIHGWGAFTARGPVSLFLFTENLNAKKYCEILKSCLFPNIGHRWRFQQDNSPVHTAQITQDLFETHHLNVIDWPSNSPDLNPIENLWAILKKKVEKSVGIWIMKKKKLTVDEFKAIIMEEWKDLDHDLYLTLSRSMKNRIDEVILREGQKIDY